MGNKTELETRNGRNGKPGVTRYITFQQKKQKKRKKKGEKKTETGGKKQKITRNTETRQDKLLARQDFRKTRF